MFRFQLLSLVTTRLERVTLESVDEATSNSHKPMGVAFRMRNNLLQRKHWWISFRSTALVTARSAKRKQDKEKGPIHTLTLRPIAIGFPHPCCKQAIS